MPYQLRLSSDIAGRGPLNLSALDEKLLFSVSHSSASHKYLCSLVYSPVAALHQGGQFSAELDDETQHSRPLSFPPPPAKATLRWGSLRAEETGPLSVATCWV